MTDSVVIEIPAETMDIGAIFTKSFFDKLGLKTDVVCVKCPTRNQMEDEEHSGQEGGERAKELTMPYRFFYNIFSLFSLSFSSNNSSNEPNKVNVAVAAAPPKPPVPVKKPDIEVYKTAKSTVPGDTSSFGEFLENTIVTNPTKVEEDAPSLYDIGKKTVVSIVKPAVELHPVLLSESEDTEKPVKPVKPEETEKPEKPEETEETEDTEKPEKPVQKTVNQESTVPLFDNKKESIKEFVSIWKNPESGETPVLRIELFGKDIKRVESKSEYSHYMDEYLLKREIDIISNGRKKMVSTEYCEQYIVDGRYVILGPIEDKPKEDLKPEIQWSTIKNTEAYKKFVRYNII